MRETFLTRSRRQLASGQKWRSARWGRETLWGLKDPTTSSPWWLAAIPSCTRRIIVQLSSPMSKCLHQVTGTLHRQDISEDLRLKIKWQVKPLWTFMICVLQTKIQLLYNIIFITLSVGDGSSAAATQTSDATRHCYPNCHVRRNPACCYHPACYEKRSQICDWLNYAEGKLERALLTAGLYSSVNVVLLQGTPKIRQGFRMFWG